MGIGIGLIGYGEVGRIFAADLLAGGADRVTAYDILFDGAEGERYREAARSAQVTAAG